MSESAATPPKSAEMSVRSLLIPLNGMAMLVPNALISEVATLQEISPASGPSWMLGTIVWRGLRVPLISFEQVTNAPAGAPGRNSRAIVFNTLNGNRDLPFIAVLSQRIPRLLLVTSRMVARLDDEGPEQGVLSRMEMQGDEVVVPDIDWLEQMLVKQDVRVERVIG